MYFFVNKFYILEILLQMYDFFSKCCPNWSQACSPIVGLVPGPIGTLFAIAPTHIYLNEYSYLDLASLQLISGKVLNFSSFQDHSRLFPSGTE